MATVEIRGVEKYFGAAHIIRGVDIAIFRTVSRGMHWL